MVDYIDKLNLFEDYIRAGETARRDFRLGLELEHLILEAATLRAVPFSGENGVEGILTEMTGRDWQPVYEGDFLIGLKGSGVVITLEPGSQFELSFAPTASLHRLTEIYRGFVRKILPILEARGYLLAAVGYQPVSSIQEIELIPKKRYKYMYHYFKKRGRYAHHMMKGTASMQVNLDYDSEADYRKKVRVASYLTPLIYNLLDNTPFFEKKPCHQGSIREEIWQNCDGDRCGLLPAAFSSGYSYRDYARFILETPAIINLHQGSFYYTGGQKIKDLVSPGLQGEKELAHFFSMAFPDIRTKQYLEIRMGDSLPFKYSLGYLAFWKGLLYDRENLAQLYHEAGEISWQDMMQLRQDIQNKGTAAGYQGIPLFEKYSNLLDLAGRGLELEERKYLKPLEELAREKIIPKMITLNRLQEAGTRADVRGDREGDCPEKSEVMGNEKTDVKAKAAALEWCIERGCGIDAE